MATKVLEQSPQETVRRLDIILNEVLALRQAAQVRERRQVAQPVDWVGKLSGSLGPAQADELEYFKNLDVSWERFAE